MPSLIAEKLREFLKTRALYCALVCAAFSFAPDATAASSAKSFSPFSYYVDISPSGDCGSDLALQKAGQNLYDFELRTGCLDQWRGSYKGRAALNGSGMSVKDGGGSINFSFDSEGVKVVIRKMIFATTEGSGGEYKIGQPEEIEKDEFYLPAEQGD